MLVWIWPMLSVMEQKLLPWHCRAFLRVGWIWTFMLWNIHVFSELFLCGSKRAEPLPSTNYFFMYVLSHFSCLWLFKILCTAARQALLSMGFSRQECLSGFPCPPPEDLPNPGPPALAGVCFITCTTWEALFPLRHFFFFKDLFDVDHFFKSSIEFAIFVYIYIFLIFNILIFYIFIYFCYILFFCCMACGILASDQGSNL